MHKKWVGHAHVYIFVVRDYPKSLLKKVVFCLLSVISSIFVSRKRSKLLDRPLMSSAKFCICEKEFCDSLVASFVPSVSDQGHMGTLP